MKATTLHRIAVGGALGLLPVALWCLTQRYRGLTGDAELYAMQALSRTQPGLARDVFLSASSQDRYTVFSPLYSFFIRILGLRTAAISLLVLFKIGFYSAAWAFVRKLFDSRTAILVTALLMVIPGDYGAYEVFHMSEDMLTARTLAETLGMTALCLHFYDRRVWALVIAALGLSVHALMALPMLLCLLGLRRTARTNAMWAAAMIAGALGVALVGTLMPLAVPGFLRVMNPDWVEMIRERSEFVFLQFWRLQDWELNARPFLSLLISLIVLREPRLRSLSGSALLVGGLGLGLACVAGSIGPVAILLQAQLWRWVWVPLLVSSLLLVPTLVEMWREDRCGPFCTALLAIGWLFTAVDGVYCVAAALVLWCGRERLPPEAGRYLRFAAFGISVAVVGWIIATNWSTFIVPPIKGRSGDKMLALARSLMSLDCLPLIVVGLLWYAILRSRSLAVSGLLFLGLGTVAAIAAPGALRDIRAEGSTRQIEEFADWRAVIAPDANVFVADRYYSAGFTWLTLQRPSYLTVDQSSGVIFSLATAVEIRRRSEVLRGIEAPDWRLLSQRANHGGKYDERAKPLTKQRLIEICADPALNFVVAKEDVGFQPIRHEAPGLWTDWLLYDCRRVADPAQPP